MQPKLADAHASNALIGSSLPSGLVGVFAGATSGIGASTLKVFIKNARKPRAYLIGRSESRATIVIEECKRLNPDAELHFLASDLSLMKNVDTVCQKILEKESVVNILMMTFGDPDFDRQLTSEGLNLLVASPLFGRLLMAYNFLPLLKTAASANTISRVVSVAAGGGEGTVDLDDFQAMKVPFGALRGHLATSKTFGLEALATRAPGVAFIHTQPGIVRTPYQDRMKGILGVFFRGVMWVMTSKQVSVEESGERHLYLATSARYGPNGVQATNEDAWPTGTSVVTGTDAQKGSLVFSVNADLKGVDGKPIEVMRDYRRQGIVERVWGLIEQEYRRIGVGNVRS